MLKKYKNILNKSKQRFSYLKQGISSKKLISALLIVLLTLPFFSRSGSNGEVSIQPKEKDTPSFKFNNQLKQAKYVSEFTYGTAHGPTDIDPHTTWDGYSIDVIDQVCEGLFKYNLSEPKFEIISNLANESGQFSQDNKNYTVTLRKNIKFHDGTDFNASAVNWTFSRLAYFLNVSGNLNPSLELPQFHSLYILNDGTPIINKTVINDNYNITFVLNTPFKHFEKLLCFSGSYIISPTSTPEKEYINITTGDLIGTGPFVYDEYNESNTVKFHAYGDYWRGKANIEKLTFSIISSSYSRCSALLNGEIDLITDPLYSSKQELIDNPDITFVDAGNSSSIRYLGMNNNRINKTFRQAISYAINYSYIIDELNNGEVSRLKSPIPENILYSNWSFDVATFNISKARKTIQSMGYGLTLDPNYPGDNEDEWKSKSFLNANFTYIEGSNYYQDLYNLLEDNLDLIGIHLDSVFVSDWEQFMEKGNAGEFSLYWAGWTADYNDPSNFIDSVFSNISSTNWAKVNDTWLQNTMKEALVESDSTLREALYDEIQEYLVEDLMPFAYSHVGRNFDAYRSEFVNFSSNPFEKLWFYNIYRKSYEGGIVNIDGNEEWVEFQDAGGCTGQGTFSNPYLIEDFIIDGKGGSNCILIQNSDVFFKIKNCTFANSTNGIKLSHVQNGTIYNNTFNEIDYGICLYYSNNNSINENIIHKDSYNGIRLEYSNNTKIDNNIIKNPYEGIYLLNSEKLNLTYNIIFDGEIGIDLIGCNSTEIRFNEFYGCGIIMSPTNNFNYQTIDTTNSVNNKPVYYYNNQINLNMNNFSNAGQILLYNCNNSKIEDLEISNTTMAIEVLNSNDLIIDNVTAVSNLAGIYMFFSHNSIIRRMILSGEGFSGVALIGCNSSIIENNNISNYEEGIFLQLCYFNELLNNKILNNDYGIDIIYGSAENIVKNNEIKNNEYIGLYLRQDCRENIIYLNKFLKNVENHATDEGINNSWYFDKEGNYWDNYTGKDANDDGIGDTKHSIPGSAESEDKYPLWSDGDDLSPSITIISPKEGDNFGVNTPNFTVVIDDPNLDKMWYTLEESTQKHFFTSNSTISQNAWDDLSDGNVTITFYANDTLSHEASKKVIITKITSSGKPQEPPPDPEPDPNRGIPSYDLFIILFVLIGFTRLYRRKVIKN